MEIRENNTERPMKNEFDFRWCCRKSEVCIHPDTKCENCEFMVNNPYKNSNQTQIWDKENGRSE